MDWVYPKRRGPDWKQSWTSQTLSTISSPPLPLLAIFAIVLFLLSLSQYTTYKSQLNHTKLNFQLFLFLVPVLLIFVMRSSLVTNEMFNFRAWWGPQLRRDVADQRPAGSSGASPWGVAILVVVLLVLVSYHSSFHSKWFGSEYNRY